MDLLFYCYLWSYRLYLRAQALQSPEKIVIYQMGKVGSTTVWHSLESQGLGIPIYHVHRINAKWIGKEFKKVKANFASLRTIYPEYVHAEYLRSQLDANQMGQRWKVITLVRDPMAQIVSMFFQRYELEVRIGTNAKLTDGYSREQALDRLLSRFKQEYILKRRKHPFSWFEKELGPNLNFDLCQQPALSSTPYQIYSVPKAEILLIKLEQLNNCAQLAFKEFLGLNEFKLTSDNARLQRIGGELYADFLKHLELPDHYLEDIYNYLPVRKIYSDSEIQGFYERWVR